MDETYIDEIKEKAHELANIFDGESYAKTQDVIALFISSAMNNAPTIIAEYYMEVLRIKTLALYTSHNL